MRYFGFQSNFSLGKKVFLKGSVCSRQQGFTFMQIEGATKSSFLSACKCFKPEQLTKCHCQSYYYQTQPSSVAWQIIDFSTWQFDDFWLCMKTTNINEMYNLHRFLLFNAWLKLSKLLPNRVCVKCLLIFLLYTNVHHCTVYTIVDHCTINYRTLSNTIVHYRTLSNTIVHYRTLLYTIVHYRTLS